MEKSPDSRLKHRLKAIELVQNANKLSSDFKTAVDYGNRIVDLFYDNYVTEGYDIRKMLASGIKTINNAIRLQLNRLIKHNFLFRNLLYFDVKVN